MSEESWKECVDWLWRCHAISIDHRLIKGGKLPDLLYYLRDGVALCHLLIRLWPNAIDPKAFSQRPQNSQYLCKKNIRVFLDACKDVFGLSDGDLFATQDLFEMENWMKVINTLSKLSQTVKAKTSVPRPFFMNNANGTRQFIIPSVDEDLDIDDDRMEQSYRIVDDEEEIYDVVMGDKSLAPCPKEPPTPGVPARNTPKKTMCINELVSTEKKYLEALYKIKTNFMIPLAKVLEPYDFKKIFLKIEDFIEIHNGFMADLHMANSSPMEDTFQKATSDCFITWKENFLIYGEFCSNLTAAQDHVDMLCQKFPQIKTAVQACEVAATEGKFKLRDLLSVPMQRILKYALLLQEMIKATEPNDPEKKMLKIALDEMKDLSLYVNEVKRDNEMLQLINEIEKNIVDLQMPINTHLKDYGRLQKDGGLKVKSDRDNKTYTRNAFLFDKLMLLCKSKNDVNFYKEFVMMSQYTLDESLPVKETKDRAFNFGFVLRKKDDPNKYFAFGVKSMDLRAKWINVLKLAQENRSPPDSRTDKHFFVMSSYNKPTICDVCRKLLRGVFFQGYRCQSTHMSVHKECISKAMNISGPPTLHTPERRPSLVPKTPIGRVKALHAYNKFPPPENKRQPLSFEKGEVFDLLSNTSDWWQGRIKNDEGFFPRDAVTLVHSSDEELQNHGKPRMSRRNTEPTLPLPPRSLTKSKASSGYINAFAFGELTDYPWFVGDLGRCEASRELQHAPNGSYLVRASEKGGYALTIMYNDVKHIKIQEKDGRVSLDEEHYYVSIPELVEHHQRASLESCFSELATVLTVPYKDAKSASKYCYAVHDYSATESGQLSFRVDDLIAIINKKGEAKGWWKGRLMDKTGYFPCAYVVELENS